MFFDDLKVSFWRGQCPDHSDGFAKVPVAHPHGRCHYEHHSSEPAEFFKIKRLVEARYE